jgi:hypothetical protein
MQLLDTLIQFVCDWLPDAHFFSTTIWQPVERVAKENGQFLPEIWNFINH